MKRPHEHHRRKHKFVFVHGPDAPIPPMPPEMPRGFRMMHHRGPRHHSAWRLLHVQEDDEVLRLLYSLPGIRKDSLKIRAKPDLVKVSAVLRDDLDEILEQTKIDIRTPLDLEVDPKSAKASYLDGILEILFDVVQVGEEIPLSD